MFVNATNSRLVVGRFSLIPGAKFPAVPMTEAEKKSIEAFVKKGLLVEKAGNNESKVVEAAKAVEKAVEKVASEVAAPVEEVAAPVEPEAPAAEEAPAEEPAKRGRKSKKD